MKNEPNKRLLQDILENETSALRAEILQASLAELRRRKVREKRSIFPLAIAAGLTVAAGFLFFAKSRHTSNSAGGNEETTASAKPPKPRLEIVMTAPRTMEIVKNRKYPAIIVDNSSALQPVELLGDAELLALFPDKPAGLVPGSDGPVRLVFLDPKDRASIGRY